MAGSSYRVTERRGGRVDRQRFGTLDAAVEAIESRTVELQRDTRATPVDTKVLGRFEPVQQVVARLELAGPRGSRAGVDVRGDGSAEAYTGWVRRQVVAQRDGESACEALGRVLGR